MPDPRTPEADLDRLRARHPGWAITAAWTSAATGPDARRLAAVREGIRLTAWTPAELSALIVERERAHGWPSAQTSSPQKSARLPKTARSGPHWQT
jgi:hypothetical protein